MCTSPWERHCWSDCWELLLAVLQRTVLAEGSLPFGGWYTGPLVLKSWQSCGEPKDLSDLDLFVSVTQESYTCGMEQAEGMREFSLKIRVLKNVLGFSEQNDKNS